MPSKKKQQKPANDNGATGVAKSGIDSAALVERHNAKPALKPKAEKKPKAEQKPKAGKKVSVKTIVREAFVANPAITNDEVVAAVKKARPDSAFGDKQAQWYRWMAKKGILTGTTIEMPRQARAKKKEKAS